MIFDLEEIPPLGEKSFTLSYYLDDDIKELIKKIDTKNPKIKISSNTLAYNLKHHNDTSKDSIKKQFKLKPTNPNYIDSGAQNISIALQKGSSLPEGVTLVFGLNATLLDHDDAKVMLQKK